MVKIIFDTQPDAQMLIDSCRANPLTLQLGDNKETLRVQWDKSPQARARGWVISQLWTAVEQIAKGKQIEPRMGSNGKLGHVL
eukprot:12402019-Karenia_brevis.AAC.1